MGQCLESWTPERGPGKGIAGHSSSVGREDGAQGLRETNPLLPLTLLRNRNSLMGKQSFFSTGDKELKVFSFSLMYF